MKTKNGQDHKHGIEFIAGTTGYHERETYVSLGNIIAGRYYVYVEIEWD